MNPQFYVARPGDAQRQGPFTREQLEQAFHAGRFAASDLAWETGTKDWIPLSTLFMPPMPDFPPIPDMPPLPPPPAFSSAPSQAAIPPPPPLDQFSAYPPPPAYSSQVRPPWSSLGLTGFLLALAGAGLTSWLLFDLWEKFPATKRPMLGESATAWLAAAFGVVSLLAALPLVRSQRQVRGKGWGVLAVILGSILALGGIAGGIFANEWASIRFNKEERRAVTDLALLGRQCREYADEHGGRFPSSIEELRTDKEADFILRTYYERGSSPGSVRIVPGLTKRSPEDRVLLIDNWTTERGTRAVYTVGGRASTTPLSLTALTSEGGTLPGTDPHPANPFQAPANPTGGPDLSSPERTMQSIVAAARDGNITAMRRCITPEGFEREFGNATVGQLREEFGGMKITFKSQDQPKTESDGTVSVRAVFSLTEDGQSSNEAATFIKRGNDWLLHSL